MDDSAHSVLQHEDTRTKQCRACTRQGGGGDQRQLSANRAYG